MRIRFGFRTWLVIIIAIGVLIYEGVSSLIDNISGCGNSTLEAFENHDIAIEYENAYMEELNKELVLDDLDFSKLNRITSHSWNITKYSKGCKVQLTVSTTKDRKPIQYIADEFLINKEEARIYPITEGAKMFMDYFDIDNRILLP